MSEEPPSSPVAGTPPAGSLENVTPTALYANLSGEERQAWLALAQAGALIQAAANVILGVADPNGVTHRGAVTLRSSNSDYSVGEAVKEFLFAKARAGRSDRYLQALRVSLFSFRNARSTRPLSSITVTELETWLMKNNWAPRTQRGYLSDVSVLYNFCIRRGLTNHNPAAAVELPELEDQPPQIHTPDQVRTVLEFARERDLNLCRSLAVRYFAGLRSSEAARLQEKEIRASFIEVTAAKSKTRRRRLVSAQENLKAWLALGGELPLTDLNNRMRWFNVALLKKHGIPWAHNVTRHSFVSYHLAQFGNAGKTALEAGHSEQMLFAHYRELVTPEAASEYWRIVPTLKTD